MDDADMASVVGAVLTQIDPGYHLSAYEREGIGNGIRAAVPIIARQVREQVAQAIEADIVYADDGSLNAFAMGEQHAARIARGGAR